jgi:beta-carotene 15,15'-dioxygenase
MNSFKPYGLMALLAGSLVLAAAMLFLDHTVPHAGLWVLMFVSVTVGFGHGALDAHLLRRRFPSRPRALALAAAYLLVVMVLGWLLSRSAAAALWLLLALSVWHFGEAYARWDGLHPAMQILTRLVVGGAPVMLPMWLSPDAMAALLQSAWQGNEVQVWRWLAAIWLGLLTAWAVLCGIPRYHAARHAWYELAGALALNLAFSPLMAFAIYFGFYHSPVHIWRVWRTRPVRPTSLAADASGSPSTTSFSLTTVAATFVATLLLSAALLVLLDLNPSAMSLEAVSLRWLIVALAALTLPHLVLISLCARQLSGPAVRR